MMTIYCDESGGVGRGVMTLAAVQIEPQDADALLARFREVTGRSDELKGSRIDLGERAYVWELFERSGATATVGIALSALKPEIGEDRGDHDIAVYARLLDDVIGSMLPKTGGCAQVIIDDGRYGPAALALVRDDIARLVGACGTASLELSHRSAGLQIADVIANTFFNRALVNDRQARMAAIAQPLLDSGQIKLRLLAGYAKSDD
jgi:Protein of unknown function (DUF3800)